MAALVKGLKRICMSCGMRFYDMGKTPIVCPSCNTEFTGDMKVKIKRSRAAAVIDDEDQVEVVEAEEIEEDEAIEEGDEVSLDDLDEDEDDDMDEDIALDDDDIDIDEDDIDDLDEDFDEDDEEFEEEDDK